ncbi:hypothetical protein [Bradyrhizobium sp. Cp5.3]|uniref:hypothetical protein n=1 Tax=Bradyrhizobium sp. Cp5.3 TaxID=443598 RepID=UPI0012EC5346|nr:hypothetical protein [Bradyrhizobium sp. Cp5.3]
MDSIMEVTGKFSRDDARCDSRDSLACQQTASVNCDRQELVRRDGPQRYANCFTVKHHQSQLCQIEQWPAITEWQCSAAQTLHENRYRLTCRRLSAKCLANIEFGPPDTIGNNGCSATETAFQLILSKLRAGTLSGLAGPQFINLDIRK